MHTRFTASISLLAALALASGAEAAERRLALDPARTQVSFDLEATGHDVHGLVALRKGEIRFDPETGAAAGEILLDAGSAETGNGSRDRTLRDEVFEVASFPEIRFVPSRMMGTLTDQGPSQVTLEGTVTLHGTEHPLALPAQVTLDGERLSADFRFEVPYQDWGLSDPSILFLRVARVVSVSVHAEGAVSDGVLAQAAGGGR